jgi:hypothetical protein
MNQKWKWTLWVMAGLLVVGAGFGPRIPQPESYHHFADQRSFWAIPHFFDVVSNLGFLAVGLWGAVFVLKATSGADATFLTAKEGWPYFFFFLGVLLTAFGSAYYHWAPDDARLLWDRLPMTVGFMGLLAAVLAERISPPLGSQTLIPLVGAGMGSVLYWRWTALAGHDDLRLYVIVQFGSLALVLALCLLLPSRYTRGSDMLAVVGLYVLAKLFEGLDKEIFALGGLVSGHTLKHLAAALACYFVLRMLMLRRPSTELLASETFLLR